MFIVIMGIVFSAYIHGTEQNLNGIWRLIDDEEDVVDFVFNNGKYEIWTDKIIDYKGIYSINGDTLTMTTTHFNHLLFYGLEDRLLTKEEFRTTIEEMYEMFGMMDDLEGLLDDLFRTDILNYNISDNVLTLFYIMEYMEYYEYQQEDADENLDIGDFTYLFNRVE